MNKKYAGIVVGIAIALASAPTYAQLGGLAGSLLGGKNSNSTSKSISAENIVKKYVDGSKDVMTADVHLLNALGLKEQAAKEELAAKNLTEGATASGLEDAVAIQTESSKALAEKMNEEKVVMDDKSKKTYTKGLLYLAKGMLKYKGLTSDVKSYTPSVSSIETAGNSALYIAKSLPTSSKNLYETLKKAVSFARENKIEVPKEATSLL